MHHSSTDQGNYFVLVRTISVWRNVRYLSYSCVYFIWRVYGSLCIFPIRKSSICVQNSPPGCLFSNHADAIRKRKTSFPHKFSHDRQKSYILEIFPCRYGIVRSCTENFRIFVSDGVDRVETDFRR